MSNSKKVASPRAASTGARKRKSTVSAPKKSKSSDTKSEAKAASQGFQENSKLATMVLKLRAPKGATIDELSKATGWQTHSVRGAISGTIKKKLGLAVTSSKTDGIHTYRISV